MLLSRRLAYGGILLALIMSFVTASYFSPLADLVFFTLTSTCIAIMVVISGYSSGLILYASASLLLTIIFGPMYSGPFILFFGAYPILKGILEEKFPKVLSLIIKGAVFAAVTSIGFLTVILILNGSIIPDGISTFIEQYGFLAKIALGIAALALLFIYDNVLTVLINIIGRFLPKNGKSGSRSS